MAQVKIKSRTVIGIMKIINVFWGFEQTQKPKRIEKLKKNILKKATKNIQTVNFLILSDREDASRREWSVFCRQSWRKRRSRIWISQRTQTSTLTLVSLARKIASAKIRFGFSFLANQNLPLKNPELTRWWTKSHTTNSFLNECNQDVLVPSSWSYYCHESILKFARDHR